MRTKTPRRATHNRAPVASAMSGAPQDAIKIEFANRLQRQMVDRGWNQSEMARQAALHMPNGKFGRDNVSNYVRALSLPGPVHLRALSQALRCKPDELLPDRGIPRADDRAPPFDIRDTGDGRVWLRINQAVDKGVALKIMKILMEPE